MSKRTRVPGPIARDQALGNSGDRHSDRLSRWKSIDVNDGNWTLYDPNSGIVSVSTSSDGMRIVGDVNEDAHRMSDSKQDAGRWYQKLIGPDGNALTFGDFFSIEFLIKLHAYTGNSDAANFADSDKSGIAVGIAPPGVTNSTSFQWIGNFIYFMDADPVRIRVYTGGTDGRGNVTDTLCTGVHTSISPPIDDDDSGDANPSLRHISGVIIDANSDATHLSNAGTRAPINDQEYTATDEVYLMVSNNWSTDAPAGAANSDSTWKMWYRVNVARDGITPTYIPGGGESG